VRLSRGEGLVVGLLIAGLFVIAVVVQHRNVVWWLVEMMFILGLTVVLGPIAVRFFSRLFQRR
jgi:hypothetical protein